MLYVNERQAVKKKILLRNDTVNSKRNCTIDDKIKPRRIINQIDSRSDELEEIKDEHNFTQRADQNMQRNSSTINEVCKIYM